MHKLLFFFLIGALFSCRSFSPNRMLQTPKGYEYAHDSTSEGIIYRIQPEDRLEMHIVSNDGFKLVDITQQGAGGGTTASIPYRVELNGDVKLPLLGRVNLAGMTIREAEDTLQGMYSKYYNDPFVLLTVTNRHVIVFQGDGGQGTMVKLESDNTTLFEALALAGGIPDYGRAYQIRILRGDPKNPTVYAADISSIEGLKNSELKVFSNDIIYVDAGINLRSRLSQDLAPILSILTSIIVIITFARN